MNDPNDDAEAKRARERERKREWMKTAHVRAVYPKSGSDEKHPHWLLYFDEHPPKPNRLLRGTFGPNAAKMRFAVQGEIKRWRSTSKRICETAGIPFLGRIRISALFVRRNVTYTPSAQESMFGALNRARGADSEGDRSSLKPIIDGIVDAGIIPDDNRNWIVIDDPNEQKIPKGGRKGLVIRIDPIADQ